MKIFIDYFFLFEINDEIIYKQRIFLGKILLKIYLFYIILG